MSHRRSGAPAPHRRGAVALVVALLLMSVPAVALAAEPLLTGEFLMYSTERGRDSELPTHVGDLKITSRTCNPSGTSGFTFEVIGNANGPYPGTFSERGSVTWGPEGETLSFSGSFRIVSGSTTIDGDLTLGPGAHEWKCAVPSDDFPYYRVGGEGYLAYSATIASGSTERPDSGMTAFTVNCYGETVEPCTGKDSYLGFIGSDVPPLASDDDGSASTGNDPNADEPIAAGIANPAGGYVAISEGMPQEPGTGYELLGRPLSIEAENAATVADPIVLTFIIDASLVADQPPSSVTVLRNGAPAADCDAPAPAPRRAEPDPCAYARTVAADGDLTLKVLTSHASEWAVVRRTAAANRLPIARASATPLRGRAPLNVRFKGSTSSDPDGRIVRYRWTFGDGKPASSLANPSHWYNDAKTYTAILTVTDDKGGTATARVRIDVAPHLPYAFAWRSPTRALPARNAADASKPVAVRFTLGGVFGRRILATGWPKAQRYDCRTGALVAGTQWYAHPFAAGGLSYDATTKTYTYRWEPNPRWNQSFLSCREFQIRFNDGSYHRVRYKFGG